MNIGIYDADQIWMEKAKRIVEVYAKKILSEVRVISYQNKNQLLEQKEKKLIPDVLFMNLDGKVNEILETAGIVNEMWKDCLIVYYSDNIQYATDVYCTMHIYFILKEQFEDRIASIFERIFLEQRHRCNRLSFTLPGGKCVSLTMGEILYFERIKRVTQIVTSLGTYETRDKLDEILEKLPEHEFIRCHNSYVVARGAVREKMKNCFVMRNGDTVAISRSYRGLQW